MDLAQAPEKSRLLVRAIEGEQRRAVVAAAGARAAGSVLFLILSVVTWGATGKADWAVYAPLLSGYALFALGFLAVCQRPVAARIAPAAALADVAIVYLVQRVALPISPFPAGVAGFSLGPFAVLVALSGLTLRWPAVYVTAAAATAAEIALQAEAGVGAGAMAAAGLVLFLMAALGHAAARRLRYLARDLVGAEAATEIEVARLRAADEAKETIEQMLGEARAQNARLERLQRDKDGLAQLIVHDLRTPLSTMSLSLEYLARYLAGTQPEPDALRALEDAQRTSDRLAAMVTQILDTAKLEEGRITLQPAPLVVEDLLERTRQLVRHGAHEKQVQVELDAPPELEVWGDARLLGRVLENLLSNALRHVPRGGRILVAAGQDEDGCRISVHNNGSPVDDRLRERIFEKYQQASEGGRVEGWGLGLYFCKMAVEAHGGRIAVEDVPGWSASFVVRLPETAHAMN